MSVNNMPYGTLRGMANELKNIREILEKQSTTEQSSMVGEWIKSDIPCEEWVCSECGGACWYYDVGKTVSRSRYCPNCGARMFAKDTNVLNKKGATNE